MRFGKHSIEASHSDVLNRILYVCHVCQQSWVDATHIDRRCPGLRFYAFGEIPFHLLTKKQLKALGYRLRKGQKPLGCTSEGYHDFFMRAVFSPLYDLREALPTEFSISFSEDFFTEKGD